MYEILTHPLDTNDWENTALRLGWREKWEHCCYAKDEEERDNLLGEYRLGFGAGWQFKSKKLNRRVNDEK